MKDIDAVPQVCPPKSGNGNNDNDNEGEIFDSDNSSGDNEFFGGDSFN
jgi:hypothetical protein